MTSSNQFQAQAFQINTAKGGCRTVRMFSIYPQVPALHPNREVRRAFARGQLQRLPSEWRVWQQQMAAQAAVRGLIH